VVATPGDALRRARLDKMMDATLRQRFPLIAPTWHPVQIARFATSCVEGKVYTDPSFFLTPVFFGEPGTEERKMQR
jgi:hypothetical protein